MATTTSSGATPESPQPDPLLKSGSFIDVSVYPNGEKETRKESAEKSHNSSNVEAAAVAAAPESDTSSTPARRAGGVMWDTSWLPAAWVIEERVRSSGATAGTVDRYYFDPVSNRRFRSKKEVLYFLENGTVRKKKKDPESSDAGADTVEGSVGGSKSKKSRTKPPTSASSFVFHNVPDKIIWSLTDASKDSWTPNLPGDEKVTDSTTREEWAAAFASLTTKTTGHKKF